VLRLLSRLEAQRSAAAGDLWVNPRGGEGAPPDARVPFVDLGVYTRNRAMRLYLSCKYGKTCVLLPSERNAFAPLADASSKPAKVLLSQDGEACGVQVGSKAWEHSMWVHSFITAWLPPLSVHEQPSMTLLSVDGSSLEAAGSGVLGAYRALLGGKSERSASEGRQRASVQGTSSGFCALDEWVLQLGSAQEGPPCRIRAVSRTIKRIRCTHGESGEESDMDVVQRATFHMADNRFCMRIGRQHTSNNVNYVVDLERHRWWQTCMDPECRGWRSQSETVPIEVIPDQVESGWRVHVLE
jgi:hypothetical protein